MRTLIYEGVGIEIGDVGDEMGQRLVLVGDWAWNLVMSTVDGYDVLCDNARSPDDNTTR